MLPAVIFCVYFGLMSGLVGYICWTGRHCPLPDVEVPAVDLPVREPDPGEDTQLAA